MIKNVLFSLLLVFVGINFSQADEPPFKMPAEFSVEMEVTVPNGPKMKNKMFVDGQKSRMESNMGGQEMLLITRLDKRVAYNIMPSQKTYMEVPIPKEAPQNFGPPANATWKSLGSETIEGVDCMKYESSVQRGNNAEPVKMTHWVRKDNKTLMRVESAGTITDWKNLKIGKQDPKLFEVPSDCKKMEIPAGMQKMMPPPKQ